MVAEILGSKLKRSFRLQLNEISALCIRHQTELLAVGDEEFTIVTGALADDGLDNEVKSKRTDAILDHEIGDPRSGSEWEAIAADGKGRVFIVKENNLTVAMLSARLDEHVHTITLDVTHGPDTEAQKLLDGDNKGPEGIVLLEGGRLLVVKQKAPVLLIEFGPREDDSGNTFEPRRHLAASDQFKLSNGRDTTLVPLHSWRLLDDKNELESANDLAVNDDSLHAVSSHSQSIYELPPRSKGQHELVARRRWRLPDEMELCRHRKAEGLAFDRQGHPIVALDSKDKDENVFVLKRLTQ